MGTVTTLPRSRPLTRADLDAMPDDGHRYELIDGALIVTPAPSVGHQFSVGRLHLLLAAACPADMVVLFAPLDVALAADTVMQPDLLVAHRTAFTPRDLPSAPLLAVEVLSPSTARIDLTLKRSRLEAAGCPSYWTFDPDVPELVAWELTEGGYAEVGKVRAAEVFRAARPFVVEVRPADLVL